MAVKQSEQKVNFEYVGGQMERKKGPVLRYPFFHVGMIGLEWAAWDRRQIEGWERCVALACVCVQGLWVQWRYSLQLLPFPPSSLHFCALEQWRRRPPPVPLSARKNKQVSDWSHGCKPAAFILIKHSVHFDLWPILMAKKGLQCLIAKRALQANSPPVSFELGKSRWPASWTGFSLQTAPPYGHRDPALLQSSAVHSPCPRQCTAVAGIWHDGHF